MHLWGATSACSGRQEILEQVALPQVAHPAQPPASFRHHSDTNGWARRTTLLPLEGAFSLATGALWTMQSLPAGAETRAGDPPVSPSITTTLLGTQPHRAAHSDKQASPKHTAPNVFQLILQTFCATHHSFLENLTLEIIRDKNLNGSGPRLHVSNSHFHQKEELFLGAMKRPAFQVLNSLLQGKNEVKNLGGFKRLRFCDRSKPPQLHVADRPLCKSKSIDA